MSSPSKPRKVPPKDLFCKIIGKPVRYREIESYLESSDYTREKKINWILYPRDKSHKSIFHEMCMMHSPQYIMTLVIDILGGQYLSSKLCIDLLSTIGFRGYNSENKVVFLFQNVMEKLSDFPEVKLQLLERAIVNKASYSAMREIFNHTKSILLKLYNQSTILEVAIHNKLDSGCVLQIIERGKKELIMLSKRSLLEGAISEYGIHSYYPNRILERLIHYGGRDVVMMERRWRNYNNEKMNIFQFLSEKKRLLDSISYIAKIMNLLLEKGGKELVLKTNESGQSILHNFAYFQHEEFIPIVRRIVEIGGESLLRVQDEKGNTILHQLSQRESIPSEYWKTLAYNKEVATMRNNHGKTALALALESYNLSCINALIHVAGRELILDQDKEEGKTVLHKACEQNKYDGIRGFLEIGGKDLLMKQDRHGNSALHLLPVCCDNHEKQLQCVQDMIKIGGKDLFDCTNNEGDKPLIISQVTDVAWSIAKKEVEDIDKCKVQKEKLEQELECPLCYEPFEDPHIVPECCHRFCFKCIDTAIKKSGKECPICRKRISSKRSLRRDELIGKIYKLVSSDDNGVDENQVKLVTRTKKAKSSTDTKHCEEEVEAMKVKLENQEKMLVQSASNVSQLEKRIAEKDKTNLSLRRKITAMERTNEASKQEINILKPLEKRIAEKDKTNLSLKREINAKERENEALKKEINILKPLEKRIDEKDKTNLSLKGEITAKERENNALKKEIDSLKPLEKRIAEFYKTNLSLKGEITAMERANDSLKQEININLSLRRKITAKERTNDALKKEIDILKPLEKRIAEKDETNLSLKGEINAKEREINALKQEIDSLKPLEKRIAEKDKTNLSLKGEITAKERENNALKQEIDSLKLQLSSPSGSKRSRDENEYENEDDYIIPKKRSKQHESVVSKFDINEALESENEDLLSQLKREKANHSKTIERLEDARKKLKESYHAYQR